MRKMRFNDIIIYSKFRIKIIKLQTFEAVLCMGGSNAKEFGSYYPNTLNLLHQYLINFSFARKNLKVNLRSSSELPSAGFRFSF